ncbi:hypothetical protein Goshw_015364 [Gossypium schwendimanii]|uniref:Uncharacterized protein n=1 Tax=Gossypium schwendimanii TaxID=34291 RepID=A0A7J9LFQ8_GOSSC|nr:hypothetical protein [Gossypium schwendimanii]
MIFNQARANRKQHKSDVRRSLGNDPKKPTQEATRLLLEQVFLVEILEIESIPSNSWETQISSILYSIPCWSILL